MIVGLAKREFAARERRGIRNEIVLVVEQKARDLGVGRNALHIDSDFAGLGLERADEKRLSRAIPRHDAEKSHILRALRLYDGVADGESRPERLEPVINLVWLSVGLQYSPVAAQSIAAAVKIRLVEACRLEPAQDLYRIDGGIYPSEACRRVDVLRCRRWRVELAPEVPWRSTCCAVAAGVLNWPQKFPGVM